MGRQLGADERVGVPCAHPQGAQQFVFQLGIIVIRLKECPTTHTKLFSDYTRNCEILNLVWKSDKQRADEDDTKDKKHIS